MLVIEENTVNSIMNTLFPIDKPKKVLGANLDLVLSYYNYDKLQKVRYVNTSKDASKSIIMPAGLVDFSQIVLLIGSTGNRSEITSSGFSYFLYSPHLCIPNQKMDETENQYITCISVPHTSYTKINVPGFSVFGSTVSSEEINPPLINPKTFLTTQRVYYKLRSTGEITEYGYSLLPARGCVVIWYLPYDFTVKEGTT